MRISIKVGDNFIYQDNIQPINLALSNVRALEEPKTVQTEPKAEGAESFGNVLQEEKEKIDTSWAVGNINPSGIDPVTATDDGYESIAGEYASIFKEASEKYGLDQKLIELVAKKESNFNPNVTSKSGAMGIMQLMPATAEGLGVSNPYNAYENIMGGVSLLKKYYDEFNGNIELMIAAYNAGSGAVRKFGGIPPYEETKNYINWIKERYP